ncbi:hypothetical protein F4V91_21015 [Neorhizobium galegae]|uniref:Uncharacterized protein n=1 Tax=Neorhizobium galegae TaxID=399 RepID=A0A6A1TVT4_NEOGA|nr:hypothetical protein [Neorhizobium galegae]KAB1088662.1 hypothetical protein F4V91_21015 [Neorhizobium galegae]
MNDNHKSETMSQIEMLSGDERLTVLCSHRADPACVKLAANIIRANTCLRYAELQDISGNKILAYRGKHPEEASFRIL